MDENQDFQDTDETSSEDSPVLRDLRKKLKAQEKELERFRKQQEEAETAALTQRKETVQGIMNTLGFPKLADDVSGWVEGAVTEESVKAALEARSIPLPTGDPQPQPKTPPSVSASDVGQRVADAAGGTDRRSLDERIAAAETPSELKALMEEANLVRSHS